MTQDEIIRMAVEAGILHPAKQRNVELELALERFAALVAAHEREACAKVCEDIDQRDDIHPDHVAIECAAAIRART